MGRRRFTAEFKREAVKLAVQPGAVESRIADDLGLHVSVLRKWVQQFAPAKWEARPGAPLKSEQQAELERARRDLKRVSTERDILKEAVAYVATPVFPLEGGCDCRAVRYRMLTRPLFVHCCHCRWCQRESGSAFALNALIEADRVENLAAEPELIDTPSESGKGQKFARCPKCRIAIWSNYAGVGPFAKFVRVGTLDEPDQMPPDIHIYTASKQPWVLIPEGIPTVHEYYDREKYWPAESIARMQVLLPAIKAYREAQRRAQA